MWTLGNWLEKARAEQTLPGEKALGQINGAWVTNGAAAGGGNGPVKRHNLGL